ERYNKLPARRDQLLESIDTLTNIQHLENYMDYFYEETEYIWDYMQSPTVIIDDPGRIYEGLRARMTEFEEDFETFLERGLVVKDDRGNFPGIDDYFKLYSKEDVYFCTPFQKAIKGVDTYKEIINVRSQQMLSFNGKLDMLARELRRYVDNDYKVTVVCSSEERVDNLKEFINRELLAGKVTVSYGEMTQGLDFPEDKVCFISDTDIFGQYKLRKKKAAKSKAPAKQKGQPIKSFADIQKGDYVVHEKHGIGKFIGLEQLIVRGEKKDYLKVKYAGDDMLYVPAEQMELIQKYVGANSAAPKINKLSGTEWRQTKAKAKMAIANMAKDLLEMQAARKANEGYKFGPDTVWQKEFEDSFPFDETADQLRCIEEIKRDMESPIAMDRLLCGDVGYGKTEVAARAMFKAVSEGKQVAVLVPTTILANQHYHTLKDRFEKFPFTVDVLSRFRSDAQQSKTIKGLAKGNIDLVIGTHRLLSKDINFKDLGLLVIDEEQRFGVQHKEAIKKLRKNVDVLTLSATPIPRTLHMSLIGIRDMSLIEEPPQDRYPVQTYVLEEDDYIIRDAIERELDRGGQVFVVYNRVSGVHRIAERINDLVPGKRIGVGHGQMSEQALEDIMMDFINGDLDILVATTIIESGIDIPNVNTEIVIDADKFGVSQLYQLRGRVGRSNRLAYAYLMHKKNKVLSDVAEQRLRAIKDFTEFGAGFKIAMRDLEIRGAGNVLGTEQSGHLVNVGYELYCKLVDDAVRALNGEAVESERHEANVDVNISAYIPDTYIGDEVLKLAMYKKIATATTKEDEDDIIEELTDRFGDVPGATRDLIKVARLRALAEDMGLSRVIIRGNKLTLEYPQKKKAKDTVLFLERKSENLGEAIDLLTVMGGARSAVQ
ncbi:MAG: transcription-repair coupling factor, partial [Firmicutes bacterium]|nr:transcription-repair coupling factor [Bacillota bacterium]